MSKSKNNEQKGVPVILCGGSGTRLWPLSRRLLPKQFASLPDGDTLFTKTLKRVKAAGFAKGIIVGAEAHKFHMRKILAEHGCDDWLVIHEPSSQNTAAAIALAAHAVRDTFGELPLFVLPADHLITNDKVFAEQLAVAAASALEGHIVAFGIKPHRIETGYGYIQLGDEVKSDTNTGKDKVCHAKQFKEKPDEKTCRAMLDAGDWLWNSGMFVMTPQCYLDQLQAQAPEVYRTATDAYHMQDGAVTVDADTFARCPDISVDYALMEKAEDIALIPARFEWSDIGSWAEFSRLLSEKKDGNYLLGEVVTHDCKDSMLISSKRLIAAVGLENILVVESPDAILIAPTDQTQKVREIVGKIAESGSDLTDSHIKVYRPWGSYTSIDADDNFQVKRIVVDPGQSLSLQRHQHRSEHWVVVRGTLRVTCDDKVFDLHANESTYIPIKSVHRLENTTDKPAYLIEVQCGEYLGEDDIERLSDEYGRTTKD